MTEMNLKAGLYVFAVCSALFAVWLGVGWIGSLIIGAFTMAFASAGKQTGVIDAFLKISKMGRHD